MATSRAVKPRRRHGRSDGRDESKDLEKLQRLLFDGDGRRLLPRQLALDGVLARLSDEALFRFCETQASGPLYLLPTVEFARAFGRMVRGLAAPGGTLLEVAAGDGFLTRSLKQAEPGLRWLASDSGAWEDPRARMSRSERRAKPADVSGLRLGPGVERAEAVAAIRAHQPDVVVACWLPPGKLFERILRAPSRIVIEVGAGGGVTGQGEWGWRFAHHFAPTAVERLARSRLDAGARRRTQVTVYFGRRHPEYREERPRADDWLRIFKPS